MSHNGNDRRGPMQGNIPGQGTFPSQDGPARPSARRQPASRSSYAAAPQGASAYSRDNVHGAIPLQEQVHHAPQRAHRAPVLQPAYSWWAAWPPPRRL